MILIMRVSKLIKRFGRSAVVDDISFEILSCQIVGILGSNGVGKTSTIAMLLDLLKPSYGSIIIFGEDMMQHRHKLLA